MTFSILDRDKRYRGHAFDVAKIHIRLPDNRERYYDLVEHGDSVTIVPVSEDGQLYFVTQHRIGAGERLLELPAGVLDGDEDPMLAANRELQEEIGRSADDLRLLGGFYLAPGYSDEYMTVFLARHLKESSLDPDDDEFIDISKMSIDQAYQKAYAGEFQDGKTLASLMLARPFLM